MAVVETTSINVGDVIRFKTVSPYDNVVWTGKVTAICDYDVARQFDDVDSYYQDIKRAGYSIAAKESLKYFILKISVSDTSSTIAVAAAEWIDESTLQIVQENGYTDIRIYDIDESKAKDILTYIQTAYPGYVAEIL